MDDSSILPRRLTPTGCRLAGAQLSTHVAALKKNKKAKLTADIEELVEGVEKATTALQVTKDESFTMFDVDNGADAVVAGFAETLDGMARCYARPDILPVDAAEAKRAATASRLIGALGLGSTSFLKFRQRLQYDAMQRLVTALGQANNQADVKALGLTVEAGRVVAWTGLYGRRLGITQALDTDAAQQGVNAWHSAWAALSIGVRAKYRDPNSAHDVLIRQELLSPYDTQAQAERDAQSQADAKRAAAEAEAEAERQTAALATKPPPIK